MIRAGKLKKQRFTRKTQLTSVKDGIIIANLTKLSFEHPLDHVTYKKTNR
jgi:hypothetical protein